MNVLITGITGFAGSHLAEYILINIPNSIVFGTKRVESHTENIEEIKDAIHIVECDLIDPENVESMLKKIQPDYIFHLAAQSFVADSWVDPQKTIANNIISQINILEGVRKLGLSSKIHIAGSSEEYGKIYDTELPIKETNPTRPTSPYAVSKVAQDLLGYQYFKNYGMHIVRTRAFNHSGPRRGKQFAESNFAMQLAEIHLGLKEPVIFVGNLTAKRDFTDVRDVVKGYWLALNQGCCGEVYNICSGHGYAISEILEKLITVSGVKIEIKEDPTRFRPSDVPLLVGDNTRFKTQTGWMLTIPIEQTLEDIFKCWVRKLSIIASKSV